MKKDRTTLLLTLIALLLAAVSPNLFVLAQAGYAKLSTLAVWLLLPSAALLIGVAALARSGLRAQILRGILWGLVATFGLEAVRLVGFRLGGMPGEMPRLLGVLLLDRFSQGPSSLSDLLGWTYHFWNGASFGVIFALLFGRPKRVSAMAYGIAIGIGFMASPAAIAMGVGRFGTEFGIGFPITVLLAHIAYGYLFGALGERSRTEFTSLWGRVHAVVAPTPSADPAAQSGSAQSGSE